MHTLQPARFLAPTYYEEAAEAADALAQRHRHDHAEQVASAAMRAGLPAMFVCRHISAKQTLADLLSDAVTNYVVTVPGRNPAELLCTLVAEALRSGDPRVKEAAEAFAARVAADYAATNEVQS